MRKINSNQAQVLPGAFFDLNKNETKISEMKNTRIEAIWGENQNMSASIIRIKVLSYNIHKGYSVHSRDILHKIRDAIRIENPDLIFLQEIEGSYSKNRAYRYQSQVEYLAEDHWPYFQYGKNATYGEKNHGNAILSKWPISHNSNIDISENNIEKRGLLLSTVDFPKLNRTINIACTHLNLLESARQRQLKNLSKLIHSHNKIESPLILAGDFNDWKLNANSILEKSIGVEEAFQKKNSISAKTYPSFFPILRLDRIYFRGLKMITAERLQYFPWLELSDHLPLSAEFCLT